MKIHVRLGVLAMAALAGCATSGAQPPARTPVTLRIPGQTRPVLLAQVCSPGMSCFGRVVLLPSGEVAEAAATTTTLTTKAAAAAAMMAATNDTPTTVEASKAKPDSGRGQSKAKPTAEATTETKAQPVAKKPKPCIPLGGKEGPGQFVEYRGRGIWILCRYKCGDAEITRRLDPGIEADCWNNIPTYMD